MDRDQIVCFCYKVNYGTIADCIKEGATSFQEVIEKTSAGTACGGCKVKLRKIIEEELQK